MFDISFTAKFDSFILSAKFCLKKSGVYAVIGPSGSGKSSLLQVLAGYSEINEGHICWEGIPIHRKHPSLRPISVLFQDNNLFPHLTIKKNLALVLTQWPWLSFEQKTLIRDALASTGLSFVEDRLPSKLSGGQQSRAALARVLLQQKPILILDEPFSALGPGLKDEMLDLLYDVTKKNNLYTLLVTHDPKDATRIAPETITVINGHVSGPVSTKVALNKKSGPLIKYL